MCLEWFPKAWKGDRKIYKSEDESRPSKQQHCWDQLEHWEESWRPEKACCHSDSCERPSANPNVKNSQGVS